MREESASRLIETILTEVRDIPPADRTAYIAARCPDEQVRQYVLDLVAFLQNTNLDDFEPQFAVVTDEAAETFIGKTLSEYTIREHVATGGLAFVFCASSPTKDPRIVAIKIARTARYADSLSRFEHEVRVLQQLKHPYIARFLDSGTTTHGSPYLVTEFVFGRPLREYCDDHELDIRERVELFLKLLDALAYAHEEHHLAHRDVHPHNILVTRTGQLKLVDFGLARVVTQEQVSGVFTRTTMTLPYASPEQLRLENTTAATDIFSAGVVLYELLTGHHPFTQTNPDSLRSDIELRDPVLPSLRVSSTSRFQQNGIEVEVAPEIVARRRRTTPEALAKTLHGDLDAIVLTAMRKDPADRYVSAREFAEDLRNWLRHREVAARPLSRWAATRLLIRRNRVMSIIVAAVVVLLLSTSATLLYHYVTIRQERDRLQAVATFLQQTLESQDASEHNVTVRSMLDLARRRLEHGTLADPRRMPQC